MRKQGRQDTAPERAAQAAIRAKGIEFVTSVRPEPDVRRTGDIVLADARIVVMVNGCFWHGCPKHSRATKSNTKWWSEKIGRNKARDEETVRLWTEAGWEVVVFWEHEDPEDVARHIEEVLSAKFSGVADLSITPLTSS